MTTAEILARLPELSALVVGDICLDRWCTYDPALGEPSRETGIPRMAVVSTEVTPGAGGTVANNLAALGLKRVAVMGAIGKDGFGHELAGALKVRSISSELVVQSDRFSTFTYTKFLNILNGQEDQPRADFINTKPLPVEVEDQLIANLRKFHSGFEIILVSDQAETDLGGVITGRIRGLLTDIARLETNVIWVDSRMRPELFRNVIVKPNQEEADAACARLFGRRDYQKLRKHLDAKVLYVTQGREGVVVVEDGQEILVKTKAIEKPVDICGAGDSFSAGAASALAAGSSPTEGARFGNLVASITVMKKGTGTASAEEVRAAGA